MPLWLDCVDLPKIFTNEDWFIPRAYSEVFILRAHGDHCQDYACNKQ